MKGMELHPQLEQEINALLEKCMAQDPHWESGAVQGVSGTLYVDCRSGLDCSLVFQSLRIKSASQSRLHFKNCDHCQSWYSSYIEEQRPLALLNSFYVHCRGGIFCQEVFEDAHRFLESRVHFNTCPDCLRFDRARIDNTTDHRFDPAE